MNRVALPLLSNTHLRFASTLILLAKQQHHHSHYDYRVLLVQRAARMGFMANLFAFPGGAVDKADETDDWSKYLPSAGSSFAPSEVLTYRITALRELFEETGILLHSNARTHPPRSSSSTSSASTSCSHVCDVVTPSSQSAATRKQIHDDATHFHPFIQQHQPQLQLPISQLLPWARWVTPLSEKKRFDTFFYVAAVDHEPTVSLDSSELSSFRWLNPHDAQQLAIRGEIKLPPPTTYILNELAAFPTLDAVLQYARTQRDKRCDPIMPTLYVQQDDQGQVQKNSSITALPHDPLHHHVHLVTGEPLPSSSSSSSSSTSSSSSLHRIVQHADGYWTVIKQLPSRV